MRTGDFSVLDIACGHGDALRKIRAPLSRGSPDRDRPQSLGHPRRPGGQRIRRPASSSSTATPSPIAPAQKFDFIITSQFTHHLTDEQVVGFLRWLQENAGRGWFIGDLHRHAFPYYGFPLLARAMFWHRFVREDGQISIARAFVRTEWEALLRQAGISEDQAAITWHIPFRLCVATR